MNELIQKIENQLKEPLPGKEYQLIMAPESRTLENFAKPKTNAGVLILIFPDDKNIPSIVLMKRPSYDGYHSGQVSFPGGKYESSDNSLEDTAIRETQEEFGIDTSSIRIIGKLTELHIPISGYIVYPFIAWSNKPVRFEIDKNEVDYLIKISIDRLMDISISETFWEYKEKQIRVPYFKIADEIVWGATSMILNEFIEVLYRSHKSK
jgi:8-oxo-dGTP pyrophosphatase MutT (NUDIX family)